MSLALAVSREQATHLRRFRDTDDASDAQSPSQDASTGAQLEESQADRLHRTGRNLHLARIGSELIVGEVPLVVVAFCDS